MTDRIGESIDDLHGDSKTPPPNQIASPRLLPSCSPYNSNDHQLTRLSTRMSSQSPAPPPRRSSDETSPAHGQSNPISIEDRNIQLPKLMPASTNVHHVPTNQSPLSYNTMSSNDSSSIAPPSSPPAVDGRHAGFTQDTHTHGLDLPWITRDIHHSSSTANLHPSSPNSLTHRVSELNLSAHPSRQLHSRKNQSRTACFVHSLLQNGRARSPSRSGSTDDLTRGSMLEVIKGPERRDRWNRGMTKKELSDMALGVRELSKRLGISSFSLVGC